MAPTTQIKIFLLWSERSEQQHDQDFKIYIKGSTNFRIHHFLPECIAPFYQNALRLFTRIHCAFYQTVLRHKQHEVVTPLCWRPLSRGSQLRKVSGYGLL